MLLYSWMNLSYTQAMNFFKCAFLGNQSCPFQEQWQTLAYPDPEPWFLTQPWLTFFVNLNWATCIPPWVYVVNFPYGFGFFLFFFAVAHAAPTANSTNSMSSQGAEFKSETIFVNHAEMMISGCQSNFFKRYVHSFVTLGIVISKSTYYDLHYVVVLICPAESPESHDSH